VRDLLAAVHLHYPRGIERADPRYEQTDEHARLVAARRQAAGDGRWRELLRRISALYPRRVANQSLHLPTGKLDACYSFTLSLPSAIKHRALWFRVSFLLPRHVVYCSELVEDVEQTAAIRGAAVDDVDVVVHGLRFLVSKAALGPELLRRVEEERRIEPPVMRDEILFSFSPDEVSHAEAITREIEATFGTELLPPDAGTIRVPDVATNLRRLGEATLYDCVFTDSETWVRPEPPRRAVRPAVDVSQMPPSFVATATVLAAFHRIVWALRAVDPSRAYGAVETDGALHRDEMLDAIATAGEGPAEVAHAARELAALLREWDGQGSPPPAMVAWASRRLAI
jgi:hypothetical protein